MDTSATVGQEASGAEVLRLDREWATTASLGKDLERVLSFWSEDAQVFPPGAPAVVGKAAIRAYVGATFGKPDFSVWWETSGVTVSPSGDFAYAVGRNRFTFPGPDGKPMAAHGKVVTIWHNDPLLGWRCVIDIWNDDPAPSA